MERKEGYEDVFRYGFVNVVMGCDYVNGRCLNIVKATLMSPKYLLYMIYDYYIK